MYTLQLDRCMCTILTRHASINQIKSHWKTSEGEKQAYICCMFVEGKSKTVFFPSDTLIYGICRDGTKNNNIRACEHLILGQFRMGARSAIYAPLIVVNQYNHHHRQLLSSFAGMVYKGKHGHWCVRPPFSPHIVSLPFTTIHLL